MTISQFILCVLTFFICASGFLCKMLFQTVASILLLNLDKKATFLWYFRCFSKKDFFFGYYRTIWYTYQKEEPCYIVLVTRLLPNTHCGDSYVSVRLQLSRKVVGKSAHDNPERYCGWFWIHCFSKKFERMTREAMDVCLRVLKESNKSRFDSYSVRHSVLIISHITFRDCRVHISSHRLSRNSCILQIKCLQEALLFEFVTLMVTMLLQ